MSVAPDWRFLFANADDSAGGARSPWGAAFLVNSVLYAPVGGRAFAGAQVDTPAAGDGRLAALW